MSLFGGAFSPSALPVAIDVLSKLGMGAVVGGAIGFEREIHGRPAGIRTHMLMVIGVVLFCEVSRAFAPNDQARIAAQILTGVGFLGAGTILRIGSEIKGLTSAASIWAAAALGMAISIGGAFFWVAVIGTALCLATLALVDKLERRLVNGSIVKNLEVELDARDRLVLVIDRIEQAKGQVKGIRIQSTSGPVLISMDVQGPHNRILSALSGCEGLLSVHWLD